MHILKTPPHCEKYALSPERDTKLQFCVTALEKILDVPGCPDLKEDLFRAVVWIVSELDGKYTTRYRSRAALEAPAGTVQHEHVVPMRDLWALVNGPLKPAQLLPQITACVVTRDEHRKLTACDRRPGAPFGWMRYADCKIPVVDMQEQRDLRPNDLQAMNALLEQAFRTIRRD